MGLPRMRGLKEEKHDRRAGERRRFDGIAPHEGTESPSREQSVALTQRFDGIAPHEGTESVAYGPYVVSRGVSMGLPRMRGLKALLYALRESGGMRQFRWDCPA